MDAAFVLSCFKKNSCTRMSTRKDLRCLIRLLNLESRTLYTVKRCFRVHSSELEKIKSFTAEIRLDEAEDI